MRPTRLKSAACRSTRSWLAKPAKPPSTTTRPGSAQELGNLLESDRNLLSIAGNLPSGNDVDTFHLNIDYATTIYGGSIQAIPAVSGGPKTWSTVFDVDYADGLTRSDTSLFVLRPRSGGQFGAPFLVGRESNVTDDQPGAGQGIDLDDLTRGSAGQLDPLHWPGSIERRQSGQYHGLLHRHHIQLPTAENS